MLGDVDARLDRLHVAGGEGLPVAADEVGLLVAVHSEAVPQPVSEILAVARVLDDLASRAVHLFPRRSRLQGLDSGELRAIDRRVHLPELVGGRAEADRARDVGAVAADLA